MEHRPVPLLTAVVIAALGLCLPAQERRTPPDRARIEADVAEFILPAHPALRSARGPEKLAKLAETLLAEALPEASANGSLHYSILDTALATAGRGLAVTTGLATIEEMAAHYRVEAEQLREQFLSIVADGDPDPATARAAFPALAQLAHHRWLAHDADAFQRALELTARLAGDARSDETRDLATLLSNALQTRSRTAAPRLDEHADRLAALLGSLAEHEWPRIGEVMAHSLDPETTKIAEAEARGIADADAGFLLAHAYWDLASRADHPAAAAVWNRRAAYWHEASLDGLTAMRRKLATVRIAKVRGSRGATSERQAPRLPAGTADAVAPRPPRNSASTPLDLEPDAAFQSHDGKVVSLAFLRGDDLLLTGGDSVFYTYADNVRWNHRGEDNTVKVWRADSGRQVEVLRDHLSGWPIQGFALSPDGRHFAVASCRPVADYCNATVTVFDAQTFRMEHRTALGGRPGVWHPAFSPRGDSLLALRGDSTLHTIDLRDAGTLEETRLIPGLAEHGLRCTVISHEQQRIVAGMADGKLRAWSLSDHELQGTVEAHRSAVRTLRASSRHSALLSTEEKPGTVGVWALPDMDSIATLPAVEAPTVACFVGDRDDRVALASGDEVVIWNIQTTPPTRLATLTGHDDILCIAASENGERLATGAEDGSVRIWKLPRMR